MPPAAAPPTSAGFSASRSVWMFSDGTLAAGAVRSWPSGNPDVAAPSRSGWRRCSSRRPEGCRWARTTRPTAPCGWRRRSRSTAPRPPWRVDVQRRAARLPRAARERAHEDLLARCRDFCSNVAHGTLIPPVSEPPTTSENAGVLGLVDADGEVVVDLGAGRQLDDGRRGGAGRHQQDDRDERRGRTATRRTRTGGSPPSGGDRNFDMKNPPGIQGRLVRAVGRARQRNAERIAGRVPREPGPPPRGPTGPPSRPAR